MTATEGPGPGGGPGGTGASPDDLRDTVADGGPGGARDRGPVSGGTEQDPGWDMAEPGIEKAKAGVDWFFVLTAPITAVRDKMMVLEAEGMSILPAFTGKGEGEAFLKRLAPPEPYAVQAMHLVDIGEFAESHGTSAVLMDGEGRLIRALAGNPLREGGAEGDGSPAGETSGGDPSE